MTTQENDYFLLEGKRYPIQSPPEVSPFLKEFIYPAHGIFSTASWRGYIAEWTVREKKLFLNEILQPHDPRIDKEPLFAYWVSGQIIYDLLKHSRQLGEKEQYKYVIVTIEQGNVVKEFTHEEQVMFGMVSRGWEIFPKKDADRLVGFSGRAKHQDAKGIYHGEYLTGVRTGFGHYAGTEGRQSVKPFLPKPEGWVNRFKARVSEPKFWDGRFFSSAKPSINANWYKGSWKNGLREGLGTGHYWNAGVKYIGEWKEDQFHGKGSLVLNKKTQIVGIWRNGEYVHELN